MADLPPTTKNAVGSKQSDDGTGPLDGMVSVYVNGKVTIMPLRELTDRAYELGQLDGLAKALARVERALPPHWARMAREAIEAPA